MLNLTSCDYSDAYILIKGIITREGLSELTKPADRSIKQVLFKTMFFYRFYK